MKYLLGPAGRTRTHRCLASPNRGILLGLSYVVHALSALFWVGAVLYVAYAPVPASADEVGDAGLAVDAPLLGGGLAALSL